MEFGAQPCEGVLGDRHCLRCRNAATEQELRRTSTGTSIFARFSSQRTTSPPLLRTRSCLSLYYRRLKRFSSREILDVADDRPAGHARAPPQHNQSVMAPRRTLLPKEHFAFAFGGLKTQNYHDPGARGSGSVTPLAISPCFGKVDCTYHWNEAD